MAIKKNREAQVEDRNKKIKDMDWEEVKRYLCMKHYQNPEKCPGCLSLDTCNAGQRVMELMAEREKRKAEETKAEKAKKIGNTQKGWSRARSEEYIRQVIAADDPREFLMREEGLTTQQARKKLENWRRNHPDLFVGVTWPVAHAGTNHHMKKKEQEQMKEPEITVNVEPDTEEAEISVEDFLKDFAPIPSAETVIHAVEEPAQTDFESQLKAKFDELEAERERLDEEIERLRERCAWIGKAQDALAMTISLFKTKGE